MTVGVGASTIMVGTDFDQAAGANGGNGVLTGEDGATLRVVANEQGGDGANGLIIGGGGEGHIDVTGGGRLEVVDAGLTGDSIYLLLGGAGSSQAGTGAIAVGGHGSPLLAKTFSGGIGRTRCVVGRRVTIQ